MWVTESGTYHLFSTLALPLMHGAVAKKIVLYNVLHRQLKIPNLGSDLTSDLIYESYEQMVTGLTLYFTDEHSKTPWGTATYPRW